MKINIMMVTTYYLSVFVSRGTSLQKIMADKDTTVKITASGNLIQCSAAIDIILLMDGSYSVGKGGFERSKHFAMKLVDVLDVNPDRVQMGVIQYSSKPKVEFSLNDYPTPEETKQAIKNVRFRGGSTESGKAIKHVLKKGFPGGRVDTPRIIVLLTDGKSQDNIQSSAGFAQKSGIRLFAVGVRHPQWEVLHAVASDPSDMYVFFAEQFDDAVNGLVTTLTQTTVCNDIHPRCKVESRACVRTTLTAHREYQGNHICWKRRSPGPHAAPMASICPYYRWKRIGTTIQSQCHRTLCPDPCETSPCLNGGTCITEGVEDYSCLCPLGYGGDPLCGGSKHLVPAGLTDCAVDLLFLIDGSWSTGLQGFLLAKAFVKRAVQSFFASSAKTLMAVAQYGDQVHEEIPFGRYSRASDLTKAIDDIGFRGGYTLTGKALTHVTKSSFGTSRAEVPHVVMLLSDSKPRDEAVAAAEQARRRELFILAASGSRLRGEMDRITGDPQLVFSHTNAQELHSKVQELRTRICGLNTPGCHSKSLDLVFLLDASSNVRRHDFLQIKGFVKSVLSQFDIDADLTQIAVVLFGDKPRTVFHLNTFDSEGKMKKAVSLAPYLGKSAHVGRALHHVLEDTLSVRNGARPGVHKAVVLITDSHSVDDTDPATLELRRSRIPLLVVGPGSAQPEALLEAAGSPWLGVPVPSYEQLKHYATNVVQKICKGVRSSPSLCAPNPCLNGGVCVQRDRSYSCQCVGWRGTHCERRMSMAFP